MIGHEGNWLTLVEYSHYSRISISTIRRMLKKNELKFREENGRYLIFSNLKKIEVPKVSQNTEREILELKLENTRLQMELRKTIEENNELRMLVNLYEGGSRLPELPLC
jgi:hypothetical protein